MEQLDSKVMMILEKISPSTLYAVIRSENYDGKGKKFEVCGR